MASTVFSPGTVVASTWLNDVNTVAYGILATISGTNTITAAGPATVTAYTRGLRFFFTAINNNTGPVTININGLGPKPVTKYGAVALAAGDIVAGVAAVIIYDGVEFQFVTVRQDTNYPATAGSTTAYTVTPQSPYTLITGSRATFIWNATNTSTTPTLNVASTGAVAIKVIDSGGVKRDPAVGEFVTGTPSIAVYDGTNYVVFQERKDTGGLINTQRFTAGGTYTPTAGVRSAIVEVVGGGGAGGGCLVTAAGQASAGSGGGSGAYTKAYIPTVSSVTVTVGAGGTGVNGAAGNNGAASSFGASITAPGGFGGQTSGAGVGAIVLGGGNPGAAGIGGNLVQNLGNAGGEVFVTPVASGLPPIGFKGAVGPFGGGVVVVGTGATGSTATANSGAGGGGTGNGASTAAQTGGAGGSGIVIVYEYS